MQRRHKKNKKSRHGVHRLRQRGCDVEEGSGTEARAGAGKEEMLVDGGSERIATKT